MTIGSTFGPNPNFINICYRALILPIISYDVPVWKNVLKFRFIKDKLHSFQRLWALRATRSYRSTTTMDILSMARFLPLELHLMLQADSYDILSRARSPEDREFDSRPNITNLTYPPS